MPRPRELSRSLSVFAAKTPTLPPATHTNSYALGARDVVLVEPATPYEDEQRAWIEWARALGSQGRRVIAIVATHHHIDHVGGLDVLARELALPVWMHALTAERLGMTPERLLADGDEIVLDGPLPEKWRVLHTPGHAPGHVCLHDEDTRTLVVGDMVASVGTILVETRDGDMRVYLEQLARLAAIGASLALPAHGEPIDEPTALFRKYVEHRLMREERVYAALVNHGAGGARAVDLVADAYSDASPAVWPIAVLSIEAHLVKLAGEGRAIEDGGKYVHATQGRTV